MTNSNDVGLLFIAELINRFEMRDWNLSTWQMKLALASPVFRELVHQLHLHPGT